MATLQKELNRVHLDEQNPAGTEEKARVMEWAGDLDPAKYHAAYVNLINQKNHPPEILWITKKK